MVLSALRLACLSTCFLLTAASDAIVLTPPRVVVEYGAPASANCSTNFTHLGMGWEAPLGPVDMEADVSQITWKVDSLTEWNIKPFCFINMYDMSQTTKILEVIVYKIPDSVSISLNHMGQVAEGRTYELLCDIRNIAPLKNLVVKWYKGQTVVNSSRSSETDTTPKDKLARLLIGPNKSDNGAQYRCEAQLELGAGGPQPPPGKKSEPLSINVHYSPKFSRSVEIFNQTNEEILLDCTVEANPPPTYTWITPIQDETSSKAVLSVPALRSGSYNCTATNAYGSSVKQFIIKQKTKSRDQTIFWAFLGLGLALALVLIVGYVIHRRVSSNSVV